MLSFIAIDGWKLHKSSDDAKRQLEMEKLEVRNVSRRPPAVQLRRKALDLRSSQ